MTFKTFFLEADASAVALVILLGFPALVVGPTLITSAAPSLQKPVTVFFAGDIMLDRQIRLDAEAFGYDYLINDAKPLWEKADAAVANLEGPITENPSVSVHSRSGSAENYTFTFSPEAASFLSRNDIKYVSIGNNHILNQGWDGVRSTERFLSMNGVEFFGTPASNPYRTAFLDKNGTKIAFVAYNEFWKNDADSALLAIAAAKKVADFVVVFSHWGNEYEGNPREDQRELARKFVDAGADFIVGAHSHVIQSHETYKDVPIYYSLGNFIFDQYFTPDVMCGLTLTAKFQKGHPVTVSEQSVSLTRAGKTLSSECGTSPLHS